MLKKSGLIFFIFTIIFAITLTLAATPSAVRADEPFSAGKMPDTAINGTQTMSGTGTFTFSARIYLPLVLNGYPPAPPAPTCPITSTRSYDLIPVDGRADHPDYLHGDLNLSLRGWEPVQGFPLSVQDFGGNTDGDPPRLKAIFADNRVPKFTSAYQVYDWDWNETNCTAPPPQPDPPPPSGSKKNGCRGSLLPLLGSDGNYRGITLLGMQTTAGEELRIPSRNGGLLNGNYRALVLYAEENRMTIVYLREDTVAYGYAVHFEDVCVDPNLLALYRSRVDGDGWRIADGGYQLPALNNGQVFGTAAGGEIKVAIRDRGVFMDPRSAKDWWQ